MQISLKSLSLYTLIVAALSVGVTKYMWPTVETQVKVEEKEVIKRDVRTVIKERTKPDGTQEKETIIVDNSKESSVRKFEEKTLKKKDWFVAAGAEVRGFDRFSDPIYKLEINRRILGDIYLGISASTDKSVGVQLGFSF